MRFGILGPTQVRLADGRDVAVRGPRVRALLVLLLIDAGRVVSAERLIDQIYGADPPRGATNALQSQVSRQRQVLSGEDGQRVLVEFHPAGYRLAVDRDDVDAHRFAWVAADGQRALAVGDRARAAMLLREALDLWRGAPLADVLDAPFAWAEAARLKELRLAAIEDRIEAELRLGVHEPLIAELRAVVAAQPLREPPRGQLMRALSGGRRAEALAAFEDVRRALADEFGTDPSPELAAVHVAVLRAAGPLIPARPAQPKLPAQLTSFVGREDELQRVGKLLDEARLVTLHGPGGPGKTRLAIEAAGRFAGDVCFVELAALSDGRRRLSPSCTRSVSATPGFGRRLTATGTRPIGWSRRWPTGGCCWCWCWTTVSISSPTPHGSPRGCFAPARCCESWPPAGSRWA